MVHLILNGQRRRKIVVKIKIGIYENQLFSVMFSASAQISKNTEETRCCTEGQPAVKKYTTFSKVK